MNSSARVRAVVFDLDGLMFNTEAVFSLAGHELLRRRGHQMTDELLAGMMGRRPEEAFAIMIDMFDLSEPIDALLAESRTIFYDLLPEHLAPMPGLFDLLAHIESHELPTGVATSSPRAYLDDMLGRFDLNHRFGVTLTAEDVENGKPHPEIYQKAAQNLGVAPPEMLVLEDSEAGTRSAAAAGAIVVSIPHDHSRSHDFSTATHVADALDDQLILGLIGE